MKALFWIDPLQNLDPARDTSLLFMAEAQRRGMEVWVFESPGLYFHQFFFVEAQKVRIEESGDQLLPAVISIQRRKVQDFSVLFIRKDPPVDLNYTAVLQMLAVIESEGGGPLFVNSPKALLMASEKLYTLGQPQDLPPTFSGLSLKHAMSYLSSGSCQKIFKPLNEAGSRGVRQSTANSLKEEMGEALSTEFFLLQDFMDSVFEGDRRIFLLQKKILGSISRIPQNGEFRCALGLGAELALTEITPREIEVCERLMRRMERDDILFAGADLIAGRLIEVNVTSPTLIRQFNALSGAHLERDLFDLLKKRLQ